MPITTTAPDVWSQALDLHLLDQDTFADWLYGHCMRRQPVDVATAARLVRLLALGRTPELAPFSVADFNFVALTDDDPAIVMAARAALRERYLAEKSEAVARIVWRLQDDEPDAMEAFKAWRDRQGDAGCEFDGRMR